MKKTEARLEVALAANRHLERELTATKEAHGKLSVELHDRLFAVERERDLLMQIMRRVEFDARRDNEVDVRYLSTTVYREVHKVLFDKDKNEAL